MTRNQREDLQLMVVIACIVAAIWGFWYYYCVVQAGSTAKEYSIEEESK